MSLNAISTSVSAAPAALTLQAHGHGRGHGHKKDALETGSTDDSTSSASITGGSEIGQLPVGVSSALFGSLLQSLGQTIGTQASATPATGAVSTTSGVTAGTTTAAAASAGSSSIPAASSAAAPAHSQKVQAFMHSLFQALKQDGLNSKAGVSSPSATAAPAAAGGTALATPASYTGTLTGSLQTLIQQIGAGGTANAATQNLSSAFQQLSNASSGVASASAATPANSASSQSSNEGLQNFLNNFLASLQGSAAPALNALGNHVNANV